MPAVSDRLLLSTAPRLAAWIIGWLHRALKPEVLNEDALVAMWNDGRQVILSFWHDQLLLMIKGYRGQGAKVLISASKDGELIARTMACFGIGAVRGSSNRGGRAAFRELVDLGREPVDLVFTPDGPRGPRHEVKDGVVQLARLSGRPVVPMAFACSHGHRFGSWDRFLLPYPWGKAVYCFGTPLFFEQGESVEAFRSRLQQAMDDNTRRAGDYLKRYDLSAV